MDHLRCMLFHDRVSFDIDTTESSISHIEQFTFAEEALTDGEQGLLRPLVEPVDARRVCHRRELATAHS